MDEYEKWLEAITVPEKWLNGNQYRTGYRQACVEIAASYRAFKAKSDGGLRADLENILKYVGPKSSDPWDNGYATCAKEVEQILRAHEGGRP